MISAVSVFKSIVPELSPERVLADKFKYITDESSPYIYLPAENMKIMLER